MKKTLILTTAALFMALPVTAADNPNFPVKPHVEFTENIDENLLGDEADRPLLAAMEDRLTNPKRLKQIETEFGDVGAKLITRAYAGRIYKPIWTQAGAASLQGYIDNLYDHGIVSDEILKNDMSRTISKRFASNSPKTKAKADIAITLAWLRTAKAVSGGLSDEGGIPRPRKLGGAKFNLTDALLSSGKGNTNAELEAFTPDNRQYTILQKALVRYRGLEQAGGWLGIPEGDAIELDERDPRVPAIRQRLTVEGFYVPERDYAALATSTRETTDVDVFDAKTVEALKAFQRRHGLEDDGVIGNNTLAAMNQSVESKIDKISDSMHRWRAQGDMGERHIWANIPSFEAYAFDNGVKEITMRTIVGKPRFATPEFSDEVEYLVANPKWYLPVSIIRRQKLPKLRKDPGYAARYGYYIYDRDTGAKIDAYSVDWSEPGVGRKYRFVQSAGEGNALGDMKIIFPNQYSVYLHGTPGEHLFDKAQRAFSSGCVRLEDPVRMAKWIAGDDDAVSRGDIADAISDEDNQRFDLDEHVPVHITYFLVTATDDGAVKFHRDIYKRDDGISTVKKMAKLYKKRERALQKKIRSAPQASTQGVQ